MNNFKKNLEAEIEIEISRALAECFADKLNYFICVDPESRSISYQIQKSEFTIFEFNYEEIFGDNSLSEEDFFIENGIENWETFFYKNWDRVTIQEILGEAISHIFFELEETFEYPSDRPILKLELDNQEDVMDWEEDFAEECAIEFKNNTNLPEFLEQFIMTEFCDNYLRVYLQEC